MRRPTPGRILVLVVGLGVGVLLGWKLVLALRSDETRVRLVLEDVARLARRRDVGGVLEYLDPSYRGPSGVTYPVARRIVLAYLMRADSVEAELTPVSPVRVEGDVARVLVRARVELRMSGGTVTLSDAGYRGEVFEVTLRRHKSYFRCASVRAASADEAAPSESSEQ